MDVSYEQASIKEGGGFVADYYYIQYVRKVVIENKTVFQHMPPVGPLPMVLAQQIKDAFFTPKNLCEHGLEPIDCHTCNLSDFGCYSGEDYENAGF